jgi:DNA-nicking Smr family endonuclease
MAKKKKQSHDQSFKNNPFSSVKGFSVSEPEKKELPVQKAIEEKVVAEQDVDFTQVMEQLGVSTLNDDDLLMERAVPDVAPAQTRSESEEDLDDEGLFLAQLGTFDRVFTDEFPEQDEGGGRAEPRRMKQLRQGKVRPQETLDLHGSYRDEAREKVRHFLKNRFEQGLHTVLIVTGRGKRSPGGESVIRQDMENYLSTQAKAWVAEWGRAPKQYGGEGALVVFLRQKK